MREIKFRAWDKIDKTMRSVEELHKSRVAVPIQISDDEQELQKRLLVDTELLQFTGLKDKNGKEIYEGDIVKHRKIHAENGDIELYGMHSYMVQDGPQAVQYEHCGFFPFSGWIDSANEDLKWEVIGNIYENPELLKA